MKDSVVGWALAKLSGGPGKNKLESATLDELAKRFGLDPLARELVALAWAAEKSLEVSRVAREASGAFSRGLTVEVARHAMGQPLDGALAAGGALRRHSLITLDVAGPSQAHSEMRLSLGLCARLDGTPLELDHFAPGVRALRGAEWSEQFPASNKVAELVKDKIASVEALLATVDGCPRRDALALVIAAGKRFSRGVLALDGELIAHLAGRWELLSALRREADLEGMILLVNQVSALGEAWRALTAPPPSQPLRAPLIVLADAAHTREVTLIDGLRHQALTLNAVISVEKPAEKPVETAPPKEEDPYESIRRQAQRDAERALGIWRAPPQEVKVPPPPPQPVRAPEPPKVEAKVEEAPKVEEKVEAPPAKKRRSRKAMEHFGGEEPPPPPQQAAPPPPPPPAPEPAPIPDENALNSNAPYLPISDKPTPDELATVARTSKNPKQRFELLSELKTLKIPSVVQAMRDNAKSTDPSVRALAEEAMAGFFGPNWNRTRAVPKPIQPPISDDKNPNRPW